MDQSDGGALGRLRATNRELLVGLVEGAGRLSRSELTRRSGLSRSTVSGLVKELLADEVLVEHEDRGTAHGGGSGRPPILLGLRESPGVVVGIDVGHRHVRIGLAGLDGTVRDEERFDMDVDETPDDTLDRLEEVYRGLLDAAGASGADVRAVALGLPGPVDLEGRMTSSILPRWRGHTPAVELEPRLGIRPTVDNDAHMGTAGEVTFGAARGVADLIYVKAATGLGAGIVVDGRLVRGGTGIAGEIGHVQVDESGRVCRCGSRGCLETEVGARRLVETLQTAHHERLTVDSVLALETEGDAGVARVLGDAGRAIGRVLADLCNVLNPQRIVVGGSLGASTALLGGIREAVDRYAQPNAADAVSVVPGELGERAELMGALATALAQQRSALLR
ncbi:ROK family transcriptional regulator [Ornithinicoccus hortensis]|uniref:Putative NBD/HSP70 family sugar kinase n=1 Tax=Ornithinicoccus hortensis TaxID=82346 RepID=A0A542YPG3_9MICO|nr:ROK family protein [Ornithinicoccus hortensis]TQL49995.1 putative NBD/HSP70 family sugar kinase [Ornithinicoccus hortensis]